MTDYGDPVEQVAADLGLTLVWVHEPSGKSPPWWLVVDTRTGRDLGSAVPSTGSARIGNRMVRIADWRYLLVVYAEYAKKKGVG